MIRTVAYQTRTRGGYSTFVESVQDLPPQLADVVQADDLVLTLGAGNIGQVAAGLPRLLEGKR
jgi:UDP-N-acetylmuramate--alanine ligase